MDAYDPDMGPEPEKWLLLDEDEQHLLVGAYHESSSLPADARRVHVALHVAVETQLAEALPGPVEAMARLLEAGLGRHEAIHAICNILSETLFHSLAGPLAPQSDPDKAYEEALSRLTVDSRR